MRKLAPTLAPSLLASGLAFGLMLTAALPALAAPETATLGGSQITLHPQPFLTDEELATLRLVLVNEQALMIFVPKTGGFAALAVSPDDGFIRGGKPVPSATALAELPDAASAAAEAVKACDAARKGKAPCVLVLEVAPAQ